MPRRLVARAFGATTINAPFLPCRGYCRLGTVRSCVHQLVSFARRSDTADRLWLWQPSWLCWQDPCEVRTIWWPQRGVAFGSTCAYEQGGNGRKGRRWAFIAKTPEGLPYPTCLSVGVQSSVLQCMSLLLPSLGSHASLLLARARTVCQVSTIRKKNVAAFAKVDETDSLTNFSVNINQLFVDCLWPSWSRSLSRCAFHFSFCLRCGMTLALPACPMHENLARLAG